MKKIRTADHGLLFLEDGDYMPKLVAYLRETAGNDAADLVEEWVREQAINYAEVLGRADGARYAAEDKARRLFDEMRDERDEHLREIEELENELERVASLKDEAVAFNRALMDLCENPEKLFPEIGTEVSTGTGDDAIKGHICAYKLRRHKGGVAFFFRVDWKPSPPVWYKLSNLGKTIHICASEVEG